MLRIPFDELQATLKSILLEAGFSADRADLSARLFAEASLDGVYSHGLNRFPRYMQMIREGSIDIHAEPECINRAWALEQWDGRGGPGNLNAYAAMGRALGLAREYTIGCVGLRNTNHWMRGGSYGWQAADAGMIGMCWTNTMPNMPPWGARESRLGNNPLVLAIPRIGGHVVLDMAMSQFSFGSLTSYRRKGEMLPADGGFDEEGRLTRDPAAIERSGRPLPIGLWKGSGLALMLDMLAAVLSGGVATHQIPPDSLREVGISQVFLAIDPLRVHAEADYDDLVHRIIADLHEAEPAEPGDAVYYPGERTLITRRENMANGVPVDPEIWQDVLAM